MSAAESPASSTTLCAYLSTRGISVPEEVGEHWRPEAVGKLPVGEVQDLAALRKDSGVVACICRVGPLYGNEWPGKATILTTGAFSKVVGRLTADAKRCRHTQQ